MTTLAWDGRLLAVDRQGTMCNVRSETTKLRRCGNFVYVAAGSLSQIVLVGEWLEAGALKDARPDVKEEDCSGIVLELLTTRDGRPAPPRVFSALGAILAPLEFPPAACGSGRDFALSAMSFGLNAGDAILHAAKFDVGTGYGVDVFDTSDGTARTIRTP